MHAVICWSDDEGASWNEPFEPVKLPDINGVPGEQNSLFFTTGWHKGFDGFELGRLFGYFSAVL